MKRQWPAIVIVNLTALSCGLSFSWPTAALPKIESGEAGFTLDVSQQSWLVSIVFLGNVLSPIPSSYLVDFSGRRTSLLFVISFQVLVWALYSLDVYWILLVCRVFSGVSSGLVYTAAPMYMGESFEARLRGTAFAGFSICLFVGSFVQSLIGSVMSYANLAYACCGIHLILAIALAFVPESPYFYMSRGEDKKAEESLIALRGTCSSEQLAVIKKSATIEKRATLKELFWDNRKSLMIVISLMIVQRSAGITIFFSFTSTTLPDTFINTATSTVVVNTIWVIFTIASCLFIDRFGRRLLMSVSCFGCFIALTGLTVWYFLRDNIGIDVSKSLWFPLGCLVVHGVFCSFGIVTIPGLLQGEMYPINIKANASAFGAISAALTSMIVTKVYLPIKFSIGAYMNFLIAAASGLTGFFIAVFGMIETRGKTLEEIQEILMKKPPPNK